MKIAYYVNCVSNGGAEKVAARLTEIWHSLGHEIVLLTTNPSGANEYSHYCVDRAYIPYTLITRKKAENICKVYNLDVLVFNDSINDENFTRTFEAFRAIEGLKIAVIIHHTSNNWLYTLGNTQELMLDALMARMDAVVCVDKMWALWWYHRGARSFYVQNPISVSIAPKDKKTTDERLIVWVGRLKDWAKQPDKMVSAFVEVCGRVPDVRLIMLGTKDSLAERNLMKTVPIRIRNKIELRGFVPNVADYMSRASLHVFTSLTEVTIPQVVLESQTLGVPTIAIDMPVLRGVQGVVLARDEKELADMVVDFMSDSDKLCSLAKETRMAASQNDDCIEGKWRAIFKGMQAESAGMDSLSKNMMHEWCSQEEYSKLFDELHRANVFFVKRYLPDLLLFRKWRTRMNVKYILTKITERIFGRRK